LEKSGNDFEKRFETDFNRTDGRAQRAVVQGHCGLRGILRVMWLKNILNFVEYSNKCIEIKVFEYFFCIQIQF